MTADAAAGLNSEMYQSVLGQGSTPQVMQQSYQAPPEPGYQPLPGPTSGQLLGPQPATQDDWLADPAAASAKQLEYVRTTQFEPAMQQNQVQMAQIVRGQAMLRFADEFSRWGPEIDTKVAQLPPGQHTPQAYEWIIDMVRGRHAKEVHAEEVERTIEERLATGTIVRPDASASAGASPTALSSIDLGSTDLPEWWRDSCQDAGIKPRDVDKFLMDTKFYGADLEKARTKYIEAIKRDGVVASDGVLP